MAANGDQDMKTMNLYTDLDRITNELKELGHDVASGAPIPSADIHKVTMMSYSGVDGCKDVVKTMAATAETQILDLGAGIGGPARVTAELAACTVTALEYQQDLHDLSEQLSKACGLNPGTGGGAVVGACGDASAADMVEQHGWAGKFDGIVSWLAILHIPGREQLFKNMMGVLKPGGTIYVEDFFRRAEKGEFTAEQAKSLEVDVSIPKPLPTKAQYVAELEAAGFTDIQFLDVTETWTSFVAARHDAYVAGKDRHCRVHNEGVFDRMNHFYTSVRTLFEGSALGGCRIIASRK